MSVKNGGRQYNWDRLFLYLQFCAVFLFTVFEFIFLRYLVSFRVLSGSRSLFLFSLIIPVLPGCLFRVVFHILILFCIISISFTFLCFFVLFYFGSVRA